MKVETYEVEEVRSEQIEIAEEAISLISELNLAGQESLVKRRDEGESVSVGRRVPYRRITEEERVVFDVLCPNRTAVEKFDAEPIPIRVLQVLHHAKSLDFFDKGFVVLHRSSAQVQDPVLLGVTSVPGQAWGTYEYLLARWGEELEEWPAMAGHALRVWTASRQDKLAQMKQEIDLALCRMESASVGYMVKLRGQIPYATTT